MTCGYADRDGSYVLGALSPAERLDFEEHLAGCADCARSVRELAGLPGLLARVDPAVLEQSPDEGPVPHTLLPALLREVRRSRRRRSLVVAAAAAAAVAAVTVPMAVLGAFDGSGTPVAGPSTGTGTGTGTPGSVVRRAMAPVGDAKVHASVTMASVAWGTRLELTCTYDPEGGGKQVHLPSKVTYGLFVRTRDGRTQQVGTWRSIPARTTRVTAATSATTQDIASVEVRTADGRPVLDLVG
jgi:Putative zinc-finger